MVKISVIVPIYNAEKNLSSCIKSISKQAHLNIEIILINDGSTDESLSICREFSRLDDRIIIVNKKNGGVSSARNEGISRATGDYIAFVDSDDYIHPNMYSDMLSYALKHNADIVECGYYEVKNEEIFITREFEHELTVGNINLCSNLIKNINTTNSIWNKLYKREIIGRTRFHQYSYSEDFHFNTLLFYKSKRKYTTSKEYYYYNLTEGSAMRSPFSIKYLDQIEARKSIYDFLKDKKELKELNSYVATDILISIVRLYVKMLKSQNNNNNDYQYIVYFNEVFNSYKSNIPKLILKEIKPKRIQYSVRLFYFNPKLFHILMSIGTTFY